VSDPASAKTCTYSLSWWNWNSGGCPPSLTRGPHNQASSALVDPDAALCPDPRHWFHAASLGSPEITRLRLGKRSISGPDVRELVTQHRT
jgi:hypothetical protein